MIAHSSFFSRLVACARALAVVACLGWSGVLYATECHGPYVGYYGGYYACVAAGEGSCGTTSGGTGSCPFADTISYAAGSLGHWFNVAACTAPKVENATTKLCEDPPGPPAACTAAGVTASGAAAGFGSSAATAAGEAAVTACAAWVAAGKTEAQSVTAGLDAGSAKAVETAQQALSGAFATARALYDACMDAGRTGCETSYAGYYAAQAAAGINPFAMPQRKITNANGTVTRYILNEQGTWDAYTFASGADGGTGAMTGPVSVSTLSTPSPTTPPSAGSDSGSKLIQIMASGTNNPALVSLSSGGGGTITYQNTSGTTVATATLSSGGSSTCVGSGCGSVVPANDWLASGGGSASGVAASGPVSVTGGTVSVDASGGTDAGGVKAGADASLDNSATEGLLPFGEAAKKIELPWVWSFTFPVVACSPFTFGARTWVQSIDVCPMLGLLRSVIGWFYYVMMALYMWRSATSVGGSA